MPDLEEKIAGWRKRMAAGGIKATAVLDELESHLRDDIEQQLRLGVGAKTAFENAIQRIGQAGALRHEFSKVDDTSRVWWQKVKSAVSRFFGVRVAIPEDLTVSARETLELGRKEALGFHHDFIGTEHVLLGLLDTEAGVVPKVLQKMGVKREVVRAEIEKLIGPGSQCGVADTLPYTPRVRKSLELASKEARSLKRPHIGTEHIFLGLVREGGGVAALVLNRLGVNAGKAREEILKELASQKDTND